MDMHTSEDYSREFSRISQSTHNSVRAMKRDIEAKMVECENDFLMEIKREHTGFSRIWKSTILLHTQHWGRYVKLRRLFFEVEGENNHYTRLFNQYLAASETYNYADERNEANVLSDDASIKMVLWNPKYKFVSNQLVKEKNLSLTEDIKHKLYHVSKDRKTLERLSSKRFLLLLVLLEVEDFQDEETLSSWASLPESFILEALGQDSGV